MTVFDYVCVSRVSERGRELKRFGERVWDKEVKKQTGRQTESDSYTVGTVYHKSEYTPHICVNISVYLLM
jgi:hypothetical protein